MNTTFLFPSIAELNANWNSNELFPLQKLNLRILSNTKFKHKKSYINYQEGGPERSIIGSGSGSGSDWMWLLGCSI